MSKDRVLQTAVGMVDEHGIDALTMRSLAQALGVEAMSLYHYVANKNDLLDGIVEVVVGEINTATRAPTRAPNGGAAGGPRTSEAWKGAVRRRILTARAVLLRHPWAPRMIEGRTNVSPATLRYFDALLGLMRDGGFSYDLAHHAMHALGSRALGFSQELFDPNNAAESDAATSEMFATMAPQLPFLVGMLREVAHDDPESTLGWCDDQTEFEFGLDLILDGLDRIRAAG